MRSSARRRSSFAPQARIDVPADSFFTPQTARGPIRADSFFTPQILVFRQHANPCKALVGLGFRQFMTCAASSCCHDESASRLVFHPTNGRLSTEKTTVSFFNPQTIVFQPTSDSSFNPHSTRFSPTLPRKNTFKINSLRRPSTGLTRARVLTLFFFNVLTPPKGGAPPSRTHPAGFAVLPSPQGLCPSAYGLTPNRARPWRGCLQSPAAPGRGAPPPCHHGLSGPGRPQAAVLTCPASGAPCGR